VLTNQLDDAKQQRDKLSLREEALTDSVTKIDLIKLDLETNTDIASEIGPLKYIASITGKSMDQVVNWFIIALMLVFDPLAIALVISANVVFSKPKDNTPPKPKGGLNDRPDVKQAMEMAAKLSEGYEIDEDEPTALAFTPYYDEDEDEDEEDDTLSWDDLLKTNDWTDEEWNEAMMDDLEEEEEWDEEDALDQVLNTMVDDIEEEIYNTSNKPLDNINDVEELLNYIYLNENYNKYKTKNGYRILLAHLNTSGINREKLDYIKSNTPPFKGRIIIENDMCIIEHPNIYNKIY
jgi:hypothetical protein